MTGMIVGGWEYVMACYGIVWSGIFLYGGSLYLRRRRIEREGPPTQEKL
ncbi:MAG: CcmD family protein [Myxococcota bacterium]